LSPANLSYFPYSSCLRADKEPSTARDPGTASVCPSTSSRREKG
jgi:hypothetical protein